MIYWIIVVTWVLGGCHRTALMRSQHWLMYWYGSGTRHCLNQCWYRSMTPYGVTRTQLISVPGNYHSVETWKTTVKICQYLAPNHTQTRGINSGVANYHWYLLYILFVFIMFYMNWSDTDKVDAKLCTLGETIWSLLPWESFIPRESLGRQLCGAAHV